MIPLFFCRQTTTFQERNCLHMVVFKKKKKEFLPNHLHGILFLWFTSSKAIGSCSPARRDEQTWAQRFSDHLWSMRSWYLWTENKRIPMSDLRSSGKINKRIQSCRLVRKIWFQGSSWRADARPALVHQLLMCREATKYGSTLVCECKAAAPENRQMGSACRLWNNESTLYISVRRKF